MFVFRLLLLAALFDYGRANDYQDTDSSRLDREAPPLLDHEDLQPHRYQSPFLQHQDGLPRHQQDMPRPPSQHVHSHFASPQPQDHIANRLTSDGSSVSASHWRTAPADSHRSDSAGSRGRATSGHTNTVEYESVDSRGESRGKTQYLSPQGTDKSADGHWIIFDHCQLQGECSTSAHDSEWSRHTDQGSVTKQTTTKLWPHAFQAADHYAAFSPPHGAAQPALMNSWPKEADSLIDATGSATGNARHRNVSQIVKKRDLFESASAAD